MFFILYNIASLFLYVPAMLYHLYRSVSRGRPPAFSERFGHASASMVKSVGSRPRIWLHAVSVGEAIAARPLLKALRARYPGHAIIVSTTTETGRAIATGFPEKDGCIYFPFDFLPAVKRILKTIKPDVIIIMETEIWPNFTREAHRLGIPVILANGRISDRSHKGYLRFSWFFRPALEQFSRLCMQTATDRDRIVAIGAPEKRTTVTGNLKYDVPYRTVSEEEKQSLRAQYTIPAGTFVITAGSTHPGEEQMVTAMFRDILENHENTMLVLVPRHPERCNEVAALMEQEGLSFRRRTALEAGPHKLFGGGEILLVDTIGELMGLYALSDLVFVGGSLVPTGGHNLLEPAAVGVPSLFGPHMTNFREIAELVLTYGAGTQVTSREELISACRDLLENPQKRRTMGQNGVRLMRENGGATERHMEIIANHL